MYEVFFNLPPRSLKDYYKVIENPYSLRKMQKQVKGVQGRGMATASGISDFRNWDEFEAKARLLWENACFYNEEGSEIYSLAEQLKVRLPPLKMKHPRLVGNPPFSHHFFICRHPGRFFRAV